MGHLFVFTLLVFTRHMSHFIAYSGHDARNTRSSILSVISLCIKYHISYINWLHLIILHLINVLNRHYESLIYEIYLRTVINLSFCISFNNDVNLTYTYAFLLLQQIHCEDMQFVGKLIFQTE